MMIDRIQARRAALAAQKAEAQQQYEQLEQTLKLLDRNICAMAGGLQELDALLEQEQQTTEPSCEGA
jgi:regulator of protease activity HflC (stomatin/prohibitin superfamily)